MKEHKIIRIILHALGAVPAGGIIAALIIWLVKKDEYFEVDSEGRKALNFQITFFFIESILGFFWMTTISYGIHIFVVIFSLLGAYKMYLDEDFNYPFSFKII